ncbi:hypothetical protein GCM10027034_29230 [Ramlibacter solisilvae]|uniref:Uncharacterized protein n=1 Tax=Ramlibacter tataouinensis TaxID=94132 RepID=A0A127JR70_9BURK|nr:hypothetical protein [Ramlibacter tataouinensis]AMO22524.1 hypothetical protein UC35_06020 [Ramlibacter tataouinensis]
MELRLQLLETFNARGSDGATYKLCAYDRLAPDLSMAPGSERWESTGKVEYRLDDGRSVEVDGQGGLRIAGSGVVLTPEGTRARPSL